MVRPVLYLIQLLLQILVVELVRLGLFHLDKISVLYLSSLILLVNLEIMLLFVPSLMISVKYQVSGYKMLVGDIQLITHFAHQVLFNLRLNLVTLTLLLILKLNLVVMVIRRHLIQFLLIVSPERLMILVPLF